MWRTLNLNEEKLLPILSNKIFNRTYLAVFITLAMKMDINNCITITDEIKTELQNSLEITRQTWKAAINYLLKYGVLHKVQNHQDMYMIEPTLTMKSED